MTATDSTSPTSHASDRLQTALVVNAASAAFAAVMLSLANSPASWLEVPQEMLLAAGLGLAFFAGFVAWVTRQHPDSAGLIGFIAIAGSSWVVAAIVIILIPESLPTGGRNALGLVTPVVLDLGILVDGIPAAPEALRLSRVSPGPQRPRRRARAMPPGRS